MNADTTFIGGFSKTVGADAEVFVNEEGRPTAVSHENPLPVKFLNGFALPPHNDVQISYVSGTDKPSYMTFRLNGVEVYYLQFTYDGSGNLTRIQPD